MFDQADLAECIDRIEPGDLGGTLAGIDRKHDGDQSAHDVSVGFAFEDQDRIVRIARRLGGEPDLAGAALHLVFAGAFGFRHLGQGLAEFDHIAVAILPFVEEGEVVDDLVKRGHGPVRLSAPSGGALRRSRSMPVLRSSAVLTVPGSS
ncbi:hypothetical protein D3C87_1643320 [compost metagenome]